MASLRKLALLAALGIFNEVQGTGSVKTQIIRLKQVQAINLAQIGSQEIDVTKGLQEFNDSHLEGENRLRDAPGEKAAVPQTLVQKQEPKAVKFEIEEENLSQKEQIKLGIIDAPAAPKPIPQQIKKIEQEQEAAKPIEERKPSGPVSSYEVSVGQSLNLEQTNQQKILTAQRDQQDFLNGAVQSKFISEQYLQSKIANTQIPTPAQSLVEVPTPTPTQSLAEGTPGTSLSIMDIVNTGSKTPVEEAPATAKGDVKLSEADIKQALDNVDYSGGNIDRVLPVSQELSGAGFKVPLKNEDGDGYVGTIYVGSEERPVNVLFDTGSDYLAITSDLCSDDKLGEKTEDVPVFNTTTLTYVHSGKDHRKCKSQAYLSKNSTSAKKMESADDEKLDYGSAKLRGKLYQDTTCIDQNKTSCTNFQFLALYQAEGLDDTDGILGLAVHPDKKRRNLNYVWQLKNQGIIDKALVSFSVSGPGSDEESYAQFGGVNPEQIVGGIEGLTKMKTMAYRPDWTESVKQWALEGQSLAYAGEECQQVGQEKKFPAIIDTGSSAIGVPEKVFGFLKEKWHDQIPKLNCIDDDNFCQVMEKCDSVEKKLKPVQMQISGQTFEIPPAQYLHQAEGDKCQFAIHENQMKGSSGNLFVVGDTLLQHLYQVYDFEHETISLGVNTHSQGKIQMYPAGQRPEGLARLQMGEDMSPIDVKAMNEAGKDLGKL